MKGACVIDLFGRKLGSILVALLGENPIKDDNIRTHTDNKRTDPNGTLGLIRKIFLRMLGLTKEILICHLNSYTKTHGPSHVVPVMEHMSGNIEKLRNLVIHTFIQYSTYTSK
jgi:hypothetical protein